MTTSRPPLSRPVDVGTLTPTGTTLNINAGPGERAALAADLGILSIEKLTASLAVTRWRRSGLKAVGSLDAEVTQACGVTLEPVPETLHEEIEARFLPEGEGGLPKPSPELDIYHDETDPPEPFAGKSVDLGELIAEHLALGLNPYPRKPGLEFVDVIEDEVEEEEPAESPFAVLAGLKPKSGGETH
ncbi:MAG: DUF177 domain-containing protein [Hyphomicrobiales bacterium]